MSAQTDSSTWVCQSFGALPLRHKNVLSEKIFKCPAPANIFKRLHNARFCGFSLLFATVEWSPLRLPRETHFWPWKVVRACGNFTLLTCKPHSCHNSAQIWDISASKSGSAVKVFRLLTCKSASRHNHLQFFIELFGPTPSHPRL